VRIILSRKAFDSGSGGVPSPILDDGRMVPLPIPDKASPIRYQDLSWDGISVGPLVTALTRGRIPATHFAHLDPDVNPGSLPRDRGWRALFGQDGSAQGHLARQCVTVGDLFLFFGLFRPVTGSGASARPLRAAPARHVLWGWLQVGSVIGVDSCSAGELPWARYHPHFHRPPSRSNTLYLAADHLDLPGAPELAGAGHFPRYRDQLRLTAGNARRAGDWDLPGWMHPRDGQPALTYHGAPSRWTPVGQRVRLDAVGRGQEFVLDTGHYPEAVDWARTLIVAGSA
jgi:hypothetical protein